MINTLEEIFNLDCNKFDVVFTTGKYHIKFFEVKTNRLLWALATDEIGKYFEDRFPYKFLRTEYANNNY